MTTEELLMPILLKYAKRVAFKMSQDPEMASIAGSAALRAARSYNGQVPIQRWVALCVKRQVWDYWRRNAKRREEQKELGWWTEEICTYDEAKPTAELPQPELQLLTEYYIDKWPLDVLARRHDTTIYGVRKLLKAAEAKLLEITR